MAAGLHAALLAYYFPKVLFRPGQPSFEFDYSLHAYQVSRALEAFRQSGRLWAYDPFCLAGQPAGVIEDLTSKTLELFVIAVSRLGVDPWIAFNGYVLVVHLCMPLAAFTAARLFGFDLLRTALAVLSWVVLWHFDSLLHWCWYVGMISWAAASYLVVLVVALLYRALRDGRPSTYVHLGAVAALVTLVHPFAVLTLAIPLAVQYGSRFRSLRRWDHLALLLGVVAAASTALVWIGPALRFRHYIGPVDAFLWPKLQYVFFDWMDYLKDVLMTGQPVRAGFRVATLVLAGFGLLRWVKAKDDRTVALGSLLVASLVLAYASGYSSTLRQTQPYRHLGPAVLAAALIAAHVGPELFSRVELGRLDRDARTAIAVLAVAVLPHLSRTVFHYLPTLVPHHTLSASAVRPGPGPDGTSWEPDLVRMGHSPPSRDYATLAHWLEEHVGNRGRVAVHYDWILCEYLTTFTTLPTLGGIPQRNVPHVAAHLLNHDMRRSRKEDDPLARYLEQYAVAAVVTNGTDELVDPRTDLLELGTTLDVFRVYLVKRPADYFAVGKGRVTAQRLNSFTVADAQGPELVLRFHWLETLGCRPRCQVERASVAHDDAGFIRVKSPPTEFEIYNQYP